MCRICQQSPCHFRCTDYNSKKSIHICSICGEGILEGEEFIENSDGEFRHYECFHSMRELLSWLGFEIKTMEKTDE